jgi:hypothetical protein
MAATRLGRWQRSLAPTPVVGAAAVPLQAPGADGNGNCTSPRPALACITVVTGEGDNGDNVIELVAIAVLVSKVVKTNNN